MLIFNNPSVAAHVGGGAQDFSSYLFGRNKSFKTPLPFWCQSLTFGLNLVFHSIPVCLSLLPWIVTRVQANVQLHVDNSAKIIALMVCVFHRKLSSVYIMKYIPGPRLWVSAHLSALFLVKKGKSFSTSLGLLYCA